MRLHFVAITLLALPAVGQSPCGLPGVTVSVEPELAQAGTPILITLKNNSNAVIQLPSSCTFTSVSAGSSCSGPVVFASGCLSVMTPIPVRQSSSMVWNQTDESGVQVADGIYSISLSYWDASLSILSSCCPTVEVRTDPGTGYCSTGGAGSACPCGNAGGEGEGCANSTQSGGLLVGTGEAIVGADTLVLTARQCPPAVPGLFFSGPGELPGLFFGDGLRCVAGPVVRLGVVPTDAAGVASTPWSLSLREGLVPGDLRHYQYWYRDIAGPCSGGFNTTGAYRVQW